MFSILDKYIARQVISASLLVLFLLIMLRALFSILEESNLVGSGSYELADALLYVTLMIPQKVIDLFPMGVLIGSLFGLGNLAANNEITVMRAAGMTTWRIAGSTLKASIILMLGLFLVSEIIAPVASKSAQQLKTAALSDGKISTSETGVWAKRGNQFIHVASIQENGDMHNISLFELNKSYRLTKLTEAINAKFSNGRWYLRNVQITEFGSDKVSKHHLATLPWENPIDQDKIDTLTLKPEVLSLRELNNYQHYLIGNGLDASDVELAIWQKVLLPISVAIMMLLAASFVFGPMRNVSMGARVLTGVMLGFGFHLVKQSFGPISLIYGISPFVGAVIPLVVFAGITYWLMRRSS